MCGITLEGRIYFRVHNVTIRQEQVMDYLVQLLIKIHKKSARCPTVGWIPSSQGEGGPRIPRKEQREDNRVQAAALLPEVQSS